MQVEVVGDVYNGLREEGLGGSGLGQRRNGCLFVIEVRSGFTIFGKYI